MSERQHGPHDLAKLIQWGRNRLKQDNDFLWTVGGETGSGKSSLALLLAQALQGRALDVPRQFLYSVDSLRHYMQTMPEGSIFTLDEAVISGNRRRAMAAENVTLMEHLNTCRVFHQGLLFCAPQFGDLDSAIQTRAKWHLQCGPRGRVTVYEVMKGSGPKSRGTYLVERFSDAFPDPAKKYPDLWRAYLENKRAYSMRGGDGKQVAVEKFQARVRAVIRDVLG